MAEQDSIKAHAFRADLVVNNVSEVFNNYIINYRDKPIQTMMECIRARLMTRTHNKRDGTMDANWEITPIWAEKLELEKNSARYCISLQAGIALWQVTCNDRTYTVDLEKRTCECFKWNLIGLPCKHAVDAIWKSKLRPEEFVHQWLKKTSTWQHTNTLSILSLEGMLGLQHKLKTSPLQNSLDNQDQRKQEESQRMSQLFQGMLD
jgi:hypothetical protein